MAVNDTYSSNANTALNQAAPGVLGNDTDPAGSALTAQLVSGPSSGTLMLNSDGSFSYVPFANYVGSDSFTYKANNGTTSSSAATVTIAVTSTGNVLLSDDFTRAPGATDLLSPWIVSLGTWTITNGTLKGSSSPSSYASIYTYTTPLWTDYAVEGQVQFPAGAFGGGIGGRVNPVNGARYGVWVYPSGSAGGSNVMKLIKFRDWTTWNGVPMQQVSLPSVGIGWHTLKMAFNGNQIQVYYDGTMMINVTDNNYDSRASYLSGGISGDMWTYTSSYMMGLDNVLVSSSSVNSSPVAVNDAYNTNPNAVLNQAAPGVLGNDTDPKGAPLTAQLVSGPSNGTLTLNTNGSFSYTPATNFAGNDSFTYTANNGTMNSNIASVGITVGSASSAITPHEITSAATGGVCNAPAKIVAGNLLIASFLQGSKSGDPVLPSGWVLDRTQDFNSYAYRLCVAHKIAGGAEPGTYTFSGYGGSGIYDLSLVRLDGNDTSNPVDSGALASSFAASGSVDYTFPTIATTYAGELLYYVGESIGNPSCAWPVGTYELYDPIDGHSAGYEIQSTPGVAASRKITWSASSPERMGIVVAYKSATVMADNPVPATTGLSPTSATAGGSAFTLTVNGSSFVNGSVVQWKGASRTTTYVSATQLTAAITAADIVSAGTASVTVFNPAPGGGTSNAQTFTINAVDNPVPATTGLSPSSAAAGGSAFTLTVNGSSFVNGATVQWKGASRTTTYVSSTQLTAAITAADIASAGTASVTVFNPAPGGGTSNAQTFTINAIDNPVPVTTGLSPTSATAGGSAFTLTVNGSSFVNGSIVQWKGASRTTTYVSSTQLTAAITAADIASAGTASVTVFNPAPGGGTSNAQTFTINTSSGFAVTPLNGWTNLYSASPNNTSASNLAVGSIAVGSGSQRLLLVSVVMEIGTASNPAISATYGGIALTQIRITANTQREIVWMGYLKDAQIGSGSMGLTISYSGASGNVSALHVKWASYTGVNQTNPIASSAARNAGSTSVTFGSTINFVNNGMTLLVAGNGGVPATATLTATPSFTAGTATTSNAQTSRIFTTAQHTAAGSYSSSTRVSWSGTTSPSYRVGELFLCSRRTGSTATWQCYRIHSSCPSRFTVSSGIPNASFMIATTPVSRKT